MSDEQLTLTYDVAERFLPEGGRVHTFMDGGIALLGADWDRPHLLEAMKSAPEILITGQTAQRMKHGLAIREPKSKAMLFIETTRRTDEAEQAFA